MVYACAGLVRSRLQVVVVVRPLPLGNEVPGAPHRRPPVGGLPQLPLPLPRLLVVRGHPGPSPGEPEPVGAPRVAAPQHRPLLTHVLVRNFSEVGESSSGRSLAIAIHHIKTPAVLHILHVNVLLKLTANRSNFFLHAERLPPDVGWQPLLLLLRREDEVSLCHDGDVEHLVSAHI